MVSGPEALLLSRGSTSLPQPRTPRTKMSGKSGGSFGNREEISGWMVNPRLSARLLCVGSMVSLFWEWH